MANEEMIQTHVDNFLAKIAGETPIDDNPRNSTEFWLNEIAENLPGGGTTVIANPTLVGTEDELTGLQVEETKYKINGAYIHNVSYGNMAFQIVTRDKGDLDTSAKIAKVLYDLGYNSGSVAFPVKAYLQQSVSSTFDIAGGLFSTNGTDLYRYVQRVNITNGTVSVESDNYNGKTFVDVVC